MLHFSLVLDILVLRLRNWAGGLGLVCVCVCVRVLRRSSHVYHVSSCSVISPLPVRHHVDEHLVTTGEITRKALSHTHTHTHTHTATPTLLPALAWSLTVWMCVCTCLVRECVVFCCVSVCVCEQACVCVTDPVPLINEVLGVRGVWMGLTC